MFGLFKSQQEKELGLVDFAVWARKTDKAGFNFFKIRQIARQAYAEYQRLRTLEQKIYAAYTSFDPELKDVTRQELSLYSPSDRKQALQTIYDVFESQGKHGCSHLLKNDYRNDIEG